MPASSPDDRAPGDAPPDNTSPQRRIERLNWLGHVVQATGVAHRWSRRAVDVLHTRAATVAERSRHAFYDGLNPNIDEAVVVSEDDSQENSRPAQADDTRTPQ